MNIRKLLGNSSPEFWELPSMLLILGICPAMVSIGVIMIILPSSLLKILGGIVWMTFIYFYFQLTSLAVELSAPWYRPIFFKPGERIARRLSRDGTYIVINADSDFAWAKTPEGVKVLADSDWCFYDSTWFERLMQSRLERLIHYEGLSYSMAAQIHFGS